jgi:hypothetical protein
MTKILRPAADASPAGGLGRRSRSPLRGRAALRVIVIGAAIMSIEHVLSPDAIDRAIRGSAAA